MQTSEEVDKTIVVRLAQIKSLQTEMIGLQRHRNFLQPINRLPNEVLQMIFALCLPHPVWEHAGKGWLQITAVCSHWRQVAISYPRLWSNVDSILRGHWAITFIERSAPGPVDIEICLREANGGVEETIIRNIARIRTLKVEGDHATMRNFVSKLTAAAPRLESLKLSVMRHCRNSPRVVLIPSLFANTAPRLLSMDLCYEVFLPEACSFLPQLQELESMRAVSMPRALRMIARLSNAYRIRMSIALDEPPKLATPQTVITNNVTEILDLELHMAMMSIEVLHSLNFPSLNSLNLSLYLRDDAWTEFYIRPVLLAMAPHVETLIRNTGELLELLADYADDETVSFRARAEPEDEYYDPDWEPFDGVALDFHWDRDVEPEFCGSDIIFPILELFKDVEVLKVSDANSLGKELLISANPAWRGPHLYRRDRCPLPKLKKVVIKSNRIRMFGGILLRVLLAFVRHRRDMYEDAAIDEIDFARCNGYSAHITSQLEQCDIEVTWDGEYVRPCALDEPKMGRSIARLFNAKY